MYIFKVNYRVAFFLLAVQDFFNFSFLILVSAYLHCNTCMMTIRHTKSAMGKLMNEFLKV